MFNQPTLIVDSMGHLTSVPDTVKGEIMAYFTIDNPEYIEAKKRGRRLEGIAPTQKCYRLEKDELLFPRGAVRVVVGLCQNRKLKLRVIDRRTKLPRIEGIEFTGRLRPYQEAAAKDALANEFGVVEAGTGAGKTVIAIYLIAMRGLPTIISVPTKVLLYQWVESLKKFSNIENIGILGDGIEDIQPVTVAIINTLKDKAQQLVNKYSYIVVDEAHRAAADMYIDGPLVTLPTEMMTGLSATFYRNDGRDNVLHWYLGKTVHAVDPKELRSVGAVLRPHIVQKMTNFRFENAESNYQAMLTALVEDEDRNKLIANEVVQDLQSKKHGVSLVVSSRTEHLRKLKDLICLDVPEARVFVITGKTPKEERKLIIEQLEKEGVRVLLASEMIIKEGVDASKIGVLHITTPINWKGTVLQVLGRILRPEEGKKPVVVDYVDRCVGVLEYRAKQRLELLTTEGFGTLIPKAPWYLDKSKTIYAQPKVVNQEPKTTDARPEIVEPSIKNVVSQGEKPPFAHKSRISPAKSKKQKNCAVRQLSILDALKVAV